MFSGCGGTENDRLPSKFKTFITLGCKTHILVSEINFPVLNTLRIIVINFRKSVSLNFNVFFNCCFTFGKVV